MRASIFPALYQDAAHGGGVKEQPCLLPEQLGDEGVGAFRVPPFQGHHLLPYLLWGSVGSRVSAVVIQRVGIALGLLQPPEQPFGVAEGEPQFLGRLPLSNAFL